MSKTEIRTDLLRQLANHLLNGQLAHEEFYFGAYNQNGVGNMCGTAGCAIGECPALWPKDWKWVNDFVHYKNGIEHEKFFGINIEQYNHLFMPGDQIELWGKELFTDASKEDVANNILIFCDKADNDELE